LIRFLIYDIVRGKNKIRAGNNKKNKELIFMQKYAIFLFLFVLIFSGCSGADKNTDSSGQSYKVTLNFTGPSVSPNTVYTCWIEDESGKDISNFYVCNRAVGIGVTLTGDALPYWKTVKYPKNTNVDGVTGASIQGDAGLNVTRTIDFGSVTRFRVCFEIDRSTNSNAYFVDRPSFIYRSDVIDLGSLSSPYTLSLYGWMSNDTTGGSYDQQPKSGVTITDFAKYKLMTDTSYIAPTNDMVSSLSFSIAKN
jgi:hypothetical protein